MKYLFLFCFVTFLSCSSFKAERVDKEEADEKGLKITNEWMQKDTELALQDLLKQMKEHPGLRRYLSEYHGRPKLFIAELQNQTAEAYFPVDDFNDALLNELSKTGEYILVDNKAREAILKEITYQNDGMVDPTTAKSIGKQLGADMMIFGAVYMKPASLKGKTIKEYSLNVRLTDIEKAIEVMRLRTVINKYSKQSKLGW